MTLISKVHTESCCKGIFKYAKFTNLQCTNVCKNWNLIFTDEKRGGEEGSFAPRKDSFEDGQNKGNLTLDDIYYYFLNKIKNKSTDTFP